MAFTQSLIVPQLNLNNIHFLCSRVETTQNFNAHAAADLSDSVNELSVLWFYPICEIGQKVSVWNEELLQKEGESTGRV